MFGPDELSRPVTVPDLPSMPALDLPPDVPKKVVWSRPSLVLPACSTNPSNQVDRALTSDLYSTTLDTGGHACFWASHSLRRAGSPPGTSGEGVFVYDSGINPRPSGGARHNLRASSAFFNGSKPICSSSTRIRPAASSDSFFARSRSAPI